MKRKEQAVDFWLLITALILAGIGLVMVYSSSMYKSMDLVGDGMFYFKKQAVRLMIGLVIMMLMTKLNYRGYAKLGQALMVAGLFMLAALLVQKNTGSRNADRWLRLGAFTFQPSELMKVIMVVYLASAIVRMGDKIREFRAGLMPLLGVIGLSFVLIVLEPDLGTAALVIAISFSILFLGRSKLLHLVIITFPAVGAMAFTVMTVPYMKNRVTLFLEKAGGYQVTQSIIGIGSGGIFGVGLGNSVQKFFFLPENHTDFVFSIFAEEVGLLGTTILLALLLFYVYRGFRIAMEAPDMFGFLLASGLSLMIGMQVFINIGVAMKVLPTTGMTLPFISYGGTSLILSFVATGILLNISKQGNYERRLSREFGSRLHRR
ncbi:MAG: putative lipid II flippase FtsW, partial [Candidatus Latescibacteria bacterium]|nr:putative lipid II flippase FtsW [Candidatus Latescibacterota bacterium]